jgi:hypothetical protein
MFRVFSRLACAAALAILPISAVPAAQTLTPRQQQQAEEWAANNVEFVLFHEIGHLLIDQLDMPVLGREEDAADNMATWTLLSLGTNDAEQTLRDAARGWLLSGIAYGANLDDTDYYDAHSLDRQRAFNIVCLMVGSNQTHFQAVATEYGIDEARQESCYFDHQTIDRSLTALLEGQRGQAANSRGTQVEVIYQQASGRLQDAAEAFKRSGVFENVANELRTHYHLSHHVTFRARRCGEANAYYDPELVEITMCYELMEDYLTLITNDMPQEDAGQQPPVTQPTNGGGGETEKKKKEPLGG